MKALQPKRIKSQQKGSTIKARCRRGADKLRDAADKVIGRDSKAIAEALSANGKKGMLGSIKLLFELSEGSKSEEQDDAAKIRSMATELASAPQWTGSLPSENHKEADMDDES
jgi:hypothetical protein